MRYSAEDQLQIIMLRKRQLRRRRSSQITGFLSGAATCLAVTAVAAVSVFSGAATSYVSDSAYGAFLLSSKSGSYVLCGVIAFVCGALITVLCVRGKRKQDEEQTEKIRAPLSDRSDSDESPRML